MGMLLTDGLSRTPRPLDRFDDRMWKRREIENYFCQPGTLASWAEDLPSRAAFARDLDPQRLRRLMEECVTQNVIPAMLTNPKDSRWQTMKASDDILSPIMEMFFSRLDLPNHLPKARYYRLVSYVRPEDIDPEVSEVLDAIYAVSQRARPRV
jgi:hypothetical protein